MTCRFQIAKFQSIEALHSPSGGPQASPLFHIDGNLADRSRQRHSASNKLDPHASSGTGQLEIRRNVSTAGAQAGPRKADGGLSCKRSLPGSPQNGLVHWYSGSRRGTGGCCSNQAIAQATVACNGAQQDRRFLGAPQAGRIRGNPLNQPPWRARRCQNRSRVA